MRPGRVLFGLTTVLLLVIALLLLLLLMRTNRDLTSQVQALQLRVERLEAAGGQQAEATRVLGGKVEQIQTTVREQEESLRLLRQDADRVGQQAQAIQAIEARVEKVTQQAEAVDALRAQLAGYVGDARTLQERVAKLADTTQALQGRADDLAGTVAGLSQVVQGLNEQLAKQQLPGFPLPGIVVPIRP